MGIVTPRALLLLLLMILFASATFSSAQSNATKGLPLVYDPTTQKYFTGGTSVFKLKPNEETGGFVKDLQVAVDNGDFHPYSDGIKFDKEGKHTLKFRASNFVNKWSPVQFVEVFVDMTPPTTQSKFTEDRYFKEGENTYVALNSKITLFAEDNLSGIASVEFSWDNVNFVPYSSAITVEKAGKQTLYFRSTDRVGNVESTNKLDFIADNTPPNSVLKLQGPNKPTTINGKTYVSDSVAFAVEATDDVSKVKQTFAVMDGKTVPYIKPLYFLQEGQHTLGYYSVDNVGNKEEMKIISFYTVSIPPRTAAVPVGKVVNTGGINYATRDFQLKIDAKDNVVGLDRVEVKVDEEADFKTYLEPIRFRVLGMHTVSYRSVDRAGNIEPARTYTVDLEENPPETSIATAQPIIFKDGTSYSPAPNVITLNVSNSAVGVASTQVSINDGPFASYSGPITLTTDQRIYKISYKSMDKLGNEEKPKIVTYHMIGTTPIVDLFISNGKSNEEQVRTNYLEQPARNIASPQTPDKPQKGQKKPANTTGN